MFFWIGINAKIKKGIKCESISLIKAFFTIPDSNVFKKFIIILVAILSLTMCLVPPVPTNNEKTKNIAQVKMMIIDCNLIFLIEKIV